MFVQIFRFMKQILFSKKISLKISSVAIMVLIWQLVSWFSKNPSLVPPVDVLFSKMLEMISTNELGFHGLESFRRVFVSFLFGAITGVGLGLLCSSSQFIWKFLEIPLDFIRSIPPIGFVPLTISWFGIGEFSKYLVICYLTVIVVAFSTVSGIKQVNQNRIRVARCLGLSGWRLFWLIVIPSSSRSIINALQLSLGLSFISLVGVEIIGSTSGLGFIIMDSRLLLQTDRMIVTIIFIGILGIVTVSIFNLFLRLSGLIRFTR